MKIKLLLKGLLTHLPGIAQFASTKTGGTDSASYCYSVWLRHLVMAKTNGFSTNPKVVAELGPGDSLGIGLAALISGSDKYFAFDVVEYANIERNLLIFDELLTLFKNKAPIPDDTQWPSIRPRLKDYSFPSDILDEDRLHNALENSRIELLRNSVRHMEQKNSRIKYKAPWNDTRVIEKDSVDMIYSQAVLEHVDDLSGAYRAMHSWLKPSGYLSHTIDFSSHGTANEWNGHWAYSDLLWKLIRGNRPYYINREPHSAHIGLMENVGFKIVCDIKRTSESNLNIDQLGPSFKSISKDDLETRGAFVQAEKLCRI